MEIENRLPQIASLIGDKTRSLLLWSLLDGKAYTATELAIAANTSRQSTSNHLSKLIEAKLITVEKQGRHRYFQLANEQIAQVIESMASLIPYQEIEIVRSGKAQKLAFARTCYDHLAGTLSIQIVNSLVEQKIIHWNKNHFVVNNFGRLWFKELGIDIDYLKGKKRSFANKCLDWTERKHHIGGALGAAILEKFLEKDWIRKKRNTREVVITTLGEKILSEKFGITTRNTL